jgi:hypothetical protein
MNWMVTSNFVIRHTFVLWGIFIFIKTFTKFLPQRNEIILLFSWNLLRLTNIFRLVSTRPLCFKIRSIYTWILFFILNLSRNLSISIWSSRYCVIIRFWILLFSFRSNSNCKFILIFILWRWPICIKQVLIYFLLLLIIDQGFFIFRHDIRLFNTWVTYGSFTTYSGAILRFYSWFFFN